MRRPRIYSHGRSSHVLARTPGRGNLSASRNVYSNMSTKNRDPARLGEFSYEVQCIAIVREGAGTDLHFTPASDLVAILYFYHAAGSKPTLLELQYFQYTSDSGAVESVYIMDAIASKWKKLGIALGFSGPQLDSIERSKLKDVEDCCLELLEQWLQGRVVGRPLTWRTLLLAMVQTGQCTSVAQQVWTVLSDGSSAEGECVHAILL